MQLFEVAEIANFSPSEQGAYEDSLKYFRDLNNVVDTSKQEGREEGATRIIVRLIERRFGQLSEDILTAIQSLDLKESESLSEAQFEFETLSNLERWLAKH